jgi:hypothetical protein
LKPRIPRKDFVFMISPEGLARRALLVAGGRGEKRDAEGTTAPESPLRERRGVVT